MGPLNYIRVWHDNSGVGSSSGWFLKNIIIRDLHTKEQYHFICQEWLSIEKDDGMVCSLLIKITKRKDVFFQY